MEFKNKITVIKGDLSKITNILYLLCICAVSNNRNAIFIDGSNIFNPYVIARMAKFLGMNQNVLKHIHIARAFTEYQLEHIILDLENIIQQKTPEILAISNLSFFNDISNENYSIYEKLIDDISVVTKSSGIITIMSIISDNNILESKADKILNADDFNIAQFMGRTVPTFRYHLEDIISQLQIFRRALHGEDKIAFDSLLDKARKHASSCTIVPTLDPLNCILLSILIEQEKEINNLKNK